MSIEKNYLDLSDNELTNLGYKLINNREIDKGLFVFEKLSEIKPENIIIIFFKSLIPIYKNDLSDERQIILFRNSLIDIYSTFKNKIDWGKSEQRGFMGRLAIELAETCYRFGPRELSRNLYQRVYDSLWPLEHHYYYAELLAEQNFPQEMIKLVLTRAIASDPGKVDIKDELINKVRLKNLSVHLIKEIADLGYKFTNAWFFGFRKSWDKTILPHNPRKILEVGSYEGQSICYLIDRLADGSELELHSIDAWSSDVELIHHNFSQVERNFDRNITTALKNRNNIRFVKHKEFSYIGLSKLVAAGYKNYFDLIYIDGSHLAKDVLSDSVMAFHLLNVGGIMGFDDYLYDYRTQDFGSVLDNPKLAIDAFTNIYIRSMTIIDGDNAQFWLKKITD